MNCGISTLKFVIFTFNAVCAIAGFTAVTIFSVAIVELEEVNLEICIFLIAVGATVFVVSFFGCCGAYREVSGCMLTYAILLVVVLVIQLAYLFAIPSRDFVQMGVNRVQYLWLTEKNGKPLPMEAFEIDYKCCGLNGPNDYLKANLTIPESCYSHKESTTDNHLFEEGCLKAAESVYALTSKVINASIWTLCGIEVTAFIFACILASSFKRNSQMNFSRR